MKTTWWACSTLALGMLYGCQRDDQIQTYRVSKDTDTPAPMAAAPFAANPSPETAAPPDIAPPPANDPMMSQGADLGMLPAASAKEVEWKVPAGWETKPPSAMRIGSFLARGSNGQTCDISVVPLSGAAGGNLANINRWRGQINLGPISENDLSEVSESVKANGRPMVMVDFVSRDRLIDNRFKKRVIAAIYTQGERTWFFKMMGDDATVEATKPAFVQFLKSLRFNAA